MSKKGAGSHDSDEFLSVEGIRGEIRHVFVGRLSLEILRENMDITTEALLFLLERALGWCRYPFYTSQRRVLAAVNAGLNLVRGKGEQPCELEHRVVVAKLFQVGLCTQMPP